MQVMNEHDMAEDQVEDFRSKPRWSANKKTDAVLRPLRGESLDDTEVVRPPDVDVHQADIHPSSSHPVRSDTDPNPPRPPETPEHP